MPTLKRGDLEKSLRDLGFSRREARQGVQNTFKVMGDWLAKDRHVPLELGSGESRETIGEFKVRPQVHRSWSIIRRGGINRIYRRPWQIYWEDSQHKKATRPPRPKAATPARPEAATPAKSNAASPQPSAPPLPNETGQQMPVLARCLPLSSLPWTRVAASERRTRFLKVPPNGRTAST
jgi:hypothetical protein